MATVTFLLGLAGSGKSHVRKKLEAGGARPFESIEHTQEYPQLFQELTEGIDCVVEEIRFIQQADRDWIVGEFAKLPNVEVKWIAFENDPLTAAWNCLVRTNKDDPLGHIWNNYGYARVYTIPDGAEILPIHKLPCPDDA